MSSYRISLLVITVVLVATSAFIPANAPRQYKASAVTQMNLLGGGSKEAKTHEEDIELTIAEIMKHAAKMDKDSILDDDDDDSVIGNLITETKVENVEAAKSAEDPLKKIKSFGKKIKGKFKKSKK